MKQVAKAGSVAGAANNQNLTYSTGKDSKLVIDCGKRRQSAIYRAAMELIYQAKYSVYIACQYFPYGSTALRLRDAKKRRAKVSIIYNRPSNHRFPHSLPQWLVYIYERTRNPGDFFKGQLPKKSPKLHAKLMATDQAVIIGSHNFVPSGIKWGTAEIALISHDRRFAQAAVAALQKQIKK